MLLHRSLLRVPAPPLLALLFFLALTTSSAEAQERRILLVGDSWVDQAFAAGAFDIALQNEGLGRYSSEGAVTAIGGTTAAQWATAPFLALIDSELAAYPTIDIVHLSVGGNDFLGAPPGTDLVALTLQILADIDAIVAHIHGIDPSIKVVIANYDYVPASLNTEQAVITQAMIDQAATTPNAFALNYMGVLHHAFGYPGEFAAGATPLPGGYPGYVPLQGGDPAFPGHLDFFDDAIHPSDPSYVRLAEHAVDEFYGQFLDPPPVPAMGGEALGVLALALCGAGAPRLRTSRRRRSGRS